MNGGSELEESYPTFRGPVLLQNFPGCCFNRSSSDYDGSHKFPPELAHELHQYEDPI